MRTKRLVSKAPTTHTFLLTDLVKQQGFDVVKLIVDAEKSRVAGAGLPNADAYTTRLLNLLLWLRRNRARKGGLGLGQKITIELSRAPNSDGNAEMHDHYSIKVAGGLLSGKKFVLSTGNDGSSVFAKTLEDMAEVLKGSENGSPVTDIWPFVEAGSNGTVAHDTLDATTAASLERGLAWLNDQNTSPFHDGASVKLAVDRIMMRMRARANPKWVKGWEKRTTTLLLVLAHGHHGIVFKTLYGLVPGVIGASEAPLQGAMPMPVSRPLVHFTLPNPKILATPRKATTKHDSATAIARRLMQTPNIPAHKVHPIKRAHGRRGQRMKAAGVVKGQVSKGNTALDAQGTTFSDDKEALDRIVGRLYVYEQSAQPSPDADVVSTREHLQAVSHLYAERVKGTLNADELLHRENVHMEAFAQVYNRSPVVRNVLQRVMSGSFRSAKLFEGELQAADTRFCQKREAVRGRGVGRRLVPPTESTQPAVSEWQDEEPEQDLPEQDLPEQDLPEQDMPEQNVQEQQQVQERPPKQARVVGGDLASLLLN